MLTPVNIILMLNLVLLSNFNEFLCDETEEQRTIQVELKQGVLSGIVETSFYKQHEYSSFKGIPYAEPPVVDLRFLPPKPHQGWDGTYEAYDNKPTCMQFNSRMRVDEPFGLSGSEDCLYLSVFTPSLEGNRPVVVFDYNDNFRTGFNGTDTYSPEFFIEEDVVVITITYRLSLFGYLTTEDETIPANAGLRDFIEGLKWIQSNIKLFGGDPARVTIMGSRGGAVIANLLLYSDKAKGLFTGVIMQSGTALEPTFFYSNPRSKAFGLGELVNITTDNSSILLKELQKIDAEKLILEEFNLLDNEGLTKNQMTIFPFTPTIERESVDAVLTSLPEKGTIVNDVPVLIGLNSREGLDLIYNFLFQPKMLADVVDHIAMHFPIRPKFRFNKNSKKYEEAWEEIKNFYYEDGHLSLDNILDYAVYQGDVLEGYALDVAAKTLVKQLDSPVYYYMFDFRGSLNENSEFISRYSRFSLKNWGATILDELCYLHVCSRIKKNYKKLLDLVSEQAELKVMKRMVRMWTNFAKERNPTPKNDDDVLKGFTWSPMEKDKQESRYLHITKLLKMKENPLGERGTFWDVFLEKYSNMAIDGVVGDEEEKGKETEIRDEL